MWDSIEKRPAKRKKRKKHCTRGNNIVFKLNLVSGFIVEWMGKMSWRLITIFIGRWRYTSRWRSKSSPAVVGEEKVEERNENQVFHLERLSWLLADTYFRRQPINEHEHANVINTVGITDTFTQNAELFLRVTKAGGEDLICKSFTRLLWCFIE